MTCWGDECGEGDREGEMHEVDVGRKKDCSRPLRMAKEKKIVGVVGLS